MNILVLGSGGREHALAWKIKQSHQCDQLYVAPGNAGTAQLAENVGIAVDDFPALKDFVLARNISLIIVGPEDPLVKGIKDYFEEVSPTPGVAIVGPDKMGAQLEGSKDFAKKFMQKYDIPTARSRTFDDTLFNEALAYLEKTNTPIVLKADGLAAGKGVVICDTFEDARLNLKEMLVDKKFGEAGTKVVVEEFLSGMELSVFVLTDGENYKVLPEAKDYKRIGEGDTGLNTGGMGAVSPVVFADETFMEKVDHKIIRPTIKGLRSENINYSGFIFIGLMNVDGEPYVIEYNVRMGDPETEAVIPRIKNDLVELLWATANNGLKHAEIEVDEKTACTVVLVSEGYPGAYQKGKIVSGLEDAGETIIFHAGTRLNADSKVLTNGGRVLAITGLGNNITDALNKAYAETQKIKWEGVKFRKDIGADLKVLN